MPLCDKSITLRRMPCGDFTLPDETKEWTLPNCWKVTFGYSTDMICVATSIQVAITIHETMLNDFMGTRCSPQWSRQSWPADNIGGPFIKHTVRSINEGS